MTKLDLNQKAQEYFYLDGTDQGISELELGIEGYATRTSCNFDVEYGKELYEIGFLTKLNFPKLENEILKHDEKEGEFSFYNKALNAVFKNNPFDYYIDDEFHEAEQTTLDFWIYFDVNKDITLREMRDKMNDILTHIRTFNDEKNGNYLGKLL